MENKSFAGLLNYKLDWELELRAGEEEGCA